MLILAIIQSAKKMAVAQCIKSADTGLVLPVLIKHQNGKQIDLSDFDRCMIVGVRRAGLSNSKFTFHLFFQAQMFVRLCVK